jgi:FG-GAP-like repeat
MTRKLTRNTSVLRGIAPFIALLMAMVALAALAQTRGAGRPSGKSYDVFVVPDVRSAERATASALQAKHSDPPVDQPYSLSFVAAVSYGSGGPYASGFSIAIADVNGDGKPDLVVAVADFLNTGATGLVAVLLGNGDGTFQTATTYASGGAFAASVAVADVNGDGKPDVVVANCAPAVYGYCWNNTSGVGVLLGNGDGTFQSVVTYDSADGADSVAVADVNGDGKPDLVIADSVGANVGVLLGNGDGTFRSAVNYGAGGYNAGAVVIADVNRDGKVDLVVANYGSNTVGVLLGKGDGTFQPALSYASGGYAADSVAVADVNGDGEARSGGGQLLRHAPKRM